MNGFWFGISLIIGIYLAILLISEPLAQMPVVTADNNKKGASK